MDVKIASSLAQVKSTKKAWRLAAVVAFAGWLGACSDDKAWFWDGQWDRRLTVPKGVQGRCVDESLNITQQVWRLTATIHSTYACDQPYLQLIFEGDIDEAKIRKNSGDRDVTFEISDIELVGVVDISGDERIALSSSSVGDMSDKYVGEQNEIISWPVFFDENKQQMLAPVYWPVLDVAVPTHPAKDTRYRFQKRAPVPQEP